MADNSKIEWCEATWNPVTGCTKVSPGCDRCYAETFAERFRGVPGHHFENGFDVTLRPERLDQPIRWKRPRRIFVNSMSDLFHDDVPDLFITQVFDVMEQAKHHTFQLLTKRHARMRSFVTAREEAKAAYAAKFDDCPTEAMRNSPAAEWARQRAAKPPANIWLGVSVENQKWANIRIPALLQTPAAVRWISAEPLLGPVDLTRIPWPPRHPDFRLDALSQRFGQPGVWSQASAAKLDWVVVGGESGPGARPMHPQWARDLRDQCVNGGVSFLFKQWGSWAPVATHFAADRDEQGPWDTYVNLDGTTGQWAISEHHDLATNHTGNVQPGATSVTRMSKKSAGRELDNRTWDEYPAACEAVAA